MASGISTTAPCEGAQQILSAALHTFAMHGYDGTSINAVAKRAGVSKANVFHHFTSKEQLYLAVLHSASRSWGEDFAAVLEVSGGFAEQLRAMVHQILIHLAREDAQSRVVLREMLENGAPRGQQLTEEIFADNFAAETASFRRAQTSGELRADVDPILAWAATLSTCWFFFQTRDVLKFNPEFPYTEAPDRYAEGICDILLRGFSAPNTPSDGTTRR